MENIPSPARTGYGNVPSNAEYGHTGMMRGASLSVIPVVLPNS